MPCELALPGLSGDHPLGFLASVGLLRCCEELEAFRGARLRWCRGTSWQPILRHDHPVTAGELVSALAARQQGRADGREFNWSTDIKSPPPVYQNALREAGELLSRGDRRYADFLAAFTAEVSTDDKGQMEPTAFYMTSGRQEFLKEARTLARELARGITLNRLRKSSEEMFREALFGPWKYEDPQHSLGWDPSTERLHALRAKSPTKEESNGVMAAIWLGVEALPMFPCSYSEGELITTGFFTSKQLQRRKVTYFTWGLWEEPLPLDTVRSVLSLEELAGDMSQARELTQRGIVAVYRCERYKVKAKGSYYLFRPACPWL